MRLLRSVRFGEIVATVSTRRHQVDTSAYQQKGTYPIVDQGKSLVVGYTEDDSKLIRDVPVVVFGDHTRIVKLIDFPFVVGADGTKLLKSDRASPHYLFYLTEFAAAQLDNLGYSRHFKELKRVEVPFDADRKIQDRIVAVLGTWDRAIREASRYCSLLQTRLEQLREALTSTSGETTSFTLGQVTKELTTRNGAGLGADAVMGVNKGTGLAPMRDRSRTANLGRYKLLPPNGFAYNPMRLNIGSIAMSRFRRDVLVSPDYVVFATENDRCDARYLNHVRHTKQWDSFVTPAGNGSVRVRIYYEDLATLRLHLPAVTIQRRIADALDAAAHERALARRQLELFIAEKSALATRLLAGQTQLSAQRGALEAAQ